jgi:hypothetical protein
VTWEPTLVADGLVNLFGAGGALVVAAEAHRVDPRGPVTRRIVFALRFVAALFLVRALAWLTGNGPANALVGWVASATPLVSLVVAEGLLRRHGPRWLKLGLCIGPGLVVASSVLPLVPPAIQNGLLLAIVLAGFAAVAVFLLFRDGSSLTVAEDAMIRRVLIALMLLAPLIATDFRSIWPGMPVRLGAVGALLVLYIGLGSSNAHSSVAIRLASIAVYLAIAAIFALGLAASSASYDASQVLRIWAVGFSGLTFAALFSEAQGVRAERNRAIAPLIDASTAAEFADRLRRHPLLGDARILDGKALDHVRHPAFAALLAEQRVLSRAASPWGRSNQDDGVERALSLMTAHDATHLMLLTGEPLRIVAFALPAIAADARTDSDIQIARRIGELVYAREGAT